MRGSAAWSGLFLFSSLSLDLSKESRALALLDVDAGVDDGGCLVDGLCVLEVSTLLHFREEASAVDLLDVDGLVDLGSGLVHSLDGFQLGTLGDIREQLVGHVGDRMSSDDTPESSLYPFFHASSLYWLSEEIFRPFLVPNGPFDTTCTISGSEQLICTLSLTDR